MASPVGDPSNRGSGIDQFRAIIMGWIRAEIANAAKSATGLHVDGLTGDLVADRGQFRSGNFVPGSAGWALTPAGDQELHGNTVISGNTTIGGNAAITGTLSLPAGIIDNAALTSPTSPQYVYFSASNFALTTATAAKASLIVTVPAGFTKAVISITSRVVGVNPNTTGGSDGVGGDYLYCQTTIAGSGNAGFALTVNGRNTSGIHVSPFSKVLTGLTPGGTILLETRAFTAYLTWAAIGSQAADCSGIITWYR